MSLTKREQTILDCWDGGWSIERIARENGYSRDSVSTVISQFGRDSEDISFSPKALKGSSDALLKAIAAAHPYIPISASNVRPAPHWLDGCAVQQLLGPFA